MSAPSTSTFYNRKNNAVSTLLSQLTAGATSATLASGGGAKFPSSGTWFVTIWDNTTYPNNPSGDPNMEVVLVTSRSTDTLTITRAQSGTADVTHAAGSYVGLLVMDEALDQHETAINDLETVAYRTGWVAMGVTLTYSSVDNPTGVVTSSADISSILSVGMKIKFTNGGNTIYGIVTAISGTTITFLHEIAPTSATTGGGTAALNLMANSAITAPFFSYHKAPYGFPLDKRKWTLEYYGTLSNVQSSPVTNTWYNLGTPLLAIHIGAWDVSWGAAINQIAAGASYSAQVTLSTANNSESDTDFTAGCPISSPAGGAGVWFTRSKGLVVASKTTHYLNFRSITSTPTSLAWSDRQVILATCAYI